MTTPPRTGIFLVRSWREEGRFRARMTWCLDINAGTAQQISLVTADPAEVLLRLQTWMADFEHDDE